MGNGAAAARYFAKGGRKGGIRAGNVGVMVPQIMITREREKERKRVRQNLIAEPTAYLPGAASHRTFLLYPAR
jgi:hypothetical protein